MAFHQGCDVTVPRAAQEIALPVTRNGTVLHFSGPFADRDGLRDLTAPVFKDTRVLRSAYAALGSQVVQQLLFQSSTGLNEQASVNGFVGHTHALIIGILGFQPAGNLLRRPVQNQFTRNDVPQFQVDGKKAALGPQGRLPGFAVRLTGPIRRTATMTCDLPAHGRYRALTLREREERTPPDGRSNPTVTRHQTTNGGMLFAKSAPDLMQRLPCLPTTPHVEFLLRRKPKPSPLFHKHHL